jgi:argininosuccinate lyase
MMTDTHMYSALKCQRLVFGRGTIRDAYSRLAANKRGTYEPTRTVEHTHEGSVTYLCLDRIEPKMDGVVAGFRFEKVEQALIAYFQSEVKMD